MSFGGVGCFDGSGLSLCRWLSFAYRLKYRARSKDSRKIAEYGTADHKGKCLALSHVACPGSQIGTYRSTRKKGHGRIVQLWLYTTMSMGAVNHHDACVDVMVEPETVKKHGWGRKTCPLRVREGALTWTKGWVLTEK